MCFNKKKRIAILFDGSLEDRKGLVNAVLCRTKSLTHKATDYDIDVFNFQSYDSWFIRNIKHTKKITKNDSTTIDGIKIRIFWYPFTFIDYISEIKLKNRAYIRNKEYLNKYSYFCNYDLISAHSFNCGYLALKINKIYGIPYVITWHGSDIHSAPFCNNFKRNITRKIISSAKCNFFVSKKLLDISELISKGNSRKELLYNGVSKSFVKYDCIKRDTLRNQYGIINKKVVCFAGNVIEIKNPLLLPLIYKSTQDKYKADIVFWIIGDGKLKNNVENLLNKYNLDYVCWGNRPVEEMPDMLNCVDVLVLPSKNEGLPLITIEALACGANVVGSDVGGIPEAIGDEFTFALDQNFIDNISTKIVSILNGNAEQQLNDCFSWEKTAEKEYQIYKEII